MPRFFDVAARVTLAFGLLAGLIVPSSVQGAKFKVLHAFTGYRDGQNPQSTPLFDNKLGLVTTNVLGGLTADPDGSGKTCPKGCGTANSTSPKGSETVLFAFGGRNGKQPSSLIMDGKGNLLGTTYAGGDNHKGTVFMLAPDGTETVLYSFTGGSDGAHPYAGVIKDPAGNLYGTTEFAGKRSACAAGCGIVFKIAPDGSETVLHAFTGKSDDGAFPVAGLIRDSAGNLYGTTAQGGTNNYGTIFKLAPDGTETVLHLFTGSDGAYPQAALLRTKAGNLYGTTAQGGANNYGTIFKLAPNGAETVLHDFASSPDGAYPLGALIRDPAGNFYGTTEFGGGARGGCGTIFTMTPDRTETVLYALNCKSDGGDPVAGLAIDSAGNLYGTAEYGGSNLRCGNGGCGTIFELKK